MMAKLKGVYDKDPSKVVDSEVATLKCFGWLLEPASLQMLDQIGSKITAMKGGEAKPSIRKGKKGVSSDEAQERLANLFKR